MSIGLHSVYVWPFISVAYVWLSLACSYYALDTNICQWTSSFPEDIQSPNILNESNICSFWNCNQSWGNQDYPLIHAQCCKFGKCFNQFFFRGSAPDGCWWWQYFQKTITRTRRQCFHVNSVIWRRRSCGVRRRFC